mgnify:CR=1 FL=1
MRTFKLIAGLSFLLLMVACQDKKRSSQIEVARMNRNMWFWHMSPHGEKVRLIRHV